MLLGKIIRKVCMHYHLEYSLRSMIKWKCKERQSVSIVSICYKKKNDTHLILHSKYAGKIQEFFIITYFTQFPQLWGNSSMPILQMRHWEFKSHTEGCRTSHQKIRNSNCSLSDLTPNHHLPFIILICKGATGPSALENQDEKEWILSYAKWQFL